MFEKHKNDIEKLADILKGNKDPLTIVNLIKNGAGYIGDDENHWKVVKSIVDSISEEERVDIVYDAVNLIDNTFRKSRLINMLSWKERVEVKGMLNPVDKEENLSLLDLFGGVEHKAENLAENKRKHTFAKKEEERKSHDQQFSQ